MDERILKWLYDIKLAVEEINSYFISEPKTFSNYKSNILLKRATERNFEIIGEAMNRIILRNPNFSELIKDSRAIIGLRNQIIHAYDNISDENIWSILINHLPKLETEINNIIDSESK